MTNKILQSFDVFDTAILRKTYLPTDIFKVVEEKIGSAGFYEKRIEAEKLAREENKFYSIEDIYRHLPEYNMQYEIQIEFQNCFANPNIASYYSEETSVFISDMYLPSAVIKAILERAGYKNPQVFVSCELKACKSDGSLFKAVEKLTGKKIIKHWGDNYVADIEGAKRAGIESTVFKPALHNKNLNLPKVKDTYLKKYLALIEDSANTPIRKLAMYYMPLIVEFTRWVLDNRKKGQKIFFLSRDMYMPYLVAKYLFKAEDVDYLHVSRHSLAGLCMKSGNEELIRKMSFVFSEEEMENKRLQDDTEALKYLRKFDIKNDDIIADIGYAGTIQAAIDYALGIKTQGLYMQVSSHVLSGIKTRMFLNRMVIHFCLMVEFVLGSDEDCVEGYKDGEPVFTEDNRERKELAKKIIETVLLFVKSYNRRRRTSVFDIEQILIHEQYYPGEELIKIYNKKIYSNREFRESIIGFDRADIENGGLRERYARSYCQPLFKLLLERDKDLKHLSRLL